MKKECQETLERLVDRFMDRYLKMRNKPRFDEALMEVTQKMYNEMSAQWGNLALGDQAKQWQHIVDVDVVKLEAVMGEPNKLALAINSLIPLINHGPHKCPEEEAARCAMEYLVKKYKKGHLDDLLKTIKQWR